MGAATVGILTAPCAAALDEASLARKERALAELDRALEEAAC